MLVGSTLLTPPTETTRVRHSLILLFKLFRPEGVEQLFICLFSPKNVTINILFELVPDLLSYCEILTLPYWTPAVQSDSQFLFHRLNKRNLMIDAV